jgi:hypothetical protein
MFASAVFMASYVGNGTDVHELIFPSNFARTQTWYSRSYFGRNLLNEVSSNTHNKIRIEQVMPIDKPAMLMKE